MSLRVLLVDDHAVLLETLARAIGAVNGMEITAVATTAEEGRAKAEATRPDVALVDAALPDYDGVELCKRMRSVSPDTRVLMLTGAADAGLFANAMAAGARGFLLKDANLGQVLDAIRRAAAGEIVVPVELAGKLGGATAPDKGLGADLTKRELEVLALLAEGTDAKTIARSLDISWHTARSYVKNVLRKLDAHSALEAVAVAKREGILPS